MSEPNYSIIHNARVQGASGPFAVGDAMIFNPSTGFWVRSTAIARGIIGGKTEGISLSAYGGSGNSVISIQTAGPLAAEVSGLGDGASYPVRVNASARLERVASPSGSDDVVGQAQPSGRVLLSIGAVVVAASPSANVAAGDALTAATAGGTTTLAGVRGANPVEKYGAAGDGSTNDTTAITSALAAVLVVMLGAKTYVTTGNTVPNAATIRGTGMSSVLKTTSNAPVLTFASGANDTTVENLKIEGNSTGSSQHGIVWGDLGPGPGRGRFRHIHLKNLGGMGIRASAQGTGGYHVGPTLEDITVEGIPIGVQLSDGAEYITAAKLRIFGCPYGLRFSAGNLSLTNSIITGSSTIGLDIVAGGNAAHGVIADTLINHNATAIRCGAIAYEQLLLGCKVYEGAVEVTGNTGALVLQNCHLELTSYTNTNGLVIFSDCTFGDAYNANYTSWVDSGTAVTEFRGTCVDKTGKVPAFIAARQKQTFSFGSDANATLTAQQAVAQTLTVAAGTITAARTITVPRAASERRELRIINQTAYALNVGWSTGTTVSVPAGAWAYISSDGTNAIVLEAPGGASAVGSDGAAQLTTGAGVLAATRPNAFVEGSTSVGLKVNGNYALQAQGVGVNGVLTSSLANSENNAWAQTPVKSGVTYNDYSSNTVQTLYSWTILSDVMCVAFAEMYWFSTSANEMGYEARRRLFNNISGTVTARTQASLASDTDDVNVVINLDYSSTVGRVRITPKGGPSTTRYGLVFNRFERLRSI